MTNPTDTGGENPTIRDVSPPSDTDCALGAARRRSLSLNAARCRERPAGVGRVTCIWRPFQRIRVCPAQRRFSPFRGAVLQMDC